MDIKVLGSSSKGNCYLIFGAESNIIIECGVKFDKILKGLNFDTSQTKACLISHEHKDHSKYAVDVLRHKIPIFTNKATKTSLRVPKYLNDMVLPLEAREPLEIDNWQIVAFELNHDVPNFGYRVYNRKLKETLLFVTDTYFVKYRFDKIDYLMIECNYSSKTLRNNIRNGEVPEYLGKRLDKSHMSLAQAVKFAKINANAWTKLYPIHISGDNIAKEDIEKSFKNIGQLVKYWEGER